MVDTKITINDPNGGIVWSGYVDDSSYRSKEVMGDNKLFLHFSSETPVQMPLFAWTTFKGEKYFLWKPENFKKVNTENHEYQLEMDTYLIYLKSQKYEFFTSAASKDLEITFSLSANPARFARLVAENMNMKDEEAGWTVGECIEADEANLDFDDMTIWDALNMIAERFNTEWEVEEKRIHIRKVEKMSDNPIPLTYGPDGGILGADTHTGMYGGNTGITRTNGSSRVGVVRVKTDNRNIDPESYGYNSLRMPREYQIDYNGEKYVIDKTGTKLRRYNLKGYNPVLPEVTLDLTQIYPMREGTVYWTDKETKEIDTEEGKVKEEIFYFIDDSIPDELNYNGCRINGANMTVLFQNGSLGGLEFEVEYNHEKKRFDLKPNSQNGVQWPNNAMKPRIGDRYVVLNIMLPDDYIALAEHKLLDKAVEYLFDNEGDRYVYSFELDPIFAKKNWGEISGFLNLGYFIELHDMQYVPVPVNIRITGIKEFVNRPYSPKLTLSNNVRGQSVGADIRQVQNIRQTLRRTGKGISRLTEVRWRDLEELYEMLHYMLHLGFTEGIKPVAINSMMAYFGSEQLQYRWVDGKEDPITEVDMYYEVDNEKATFMIHGGIMQHMTLGIDAMQPDYGANEYRFWDISPLPPTYIGDRGFLWVYLRCDKEGTKGQFLLSETEIELEAVGGYYHFLCGSLNSPFEGTRNFFTWYGFSVITPGQIRVPKIASADGKQWLDFVNKAFHLGDENNCLSYNENLDGELRLKGVLVQSPSGETDVLEVDRGEWNAGIQYYPGDKIIYSNGNIYKCVKQIKGIIPTNTDYWRILVTRGDRGPAGYDGRDGEDAILYEYIYRASDNENLPAKPDNWDRDGYIPNGWSSIPDIGVRDYLYTTTRRKENGHWADWEEPTLFSSRGKNGRIFSYMGAYDSEKEYFGDAEIAQIVLDESSNKHYYTTINAGHFIGKSLSNEKFWKEYGGNFESIATGLLFAKQALIAGFNFDDNKIESSQYNEEGKPRILLDGKNGVFELRHTGDDFLGRSISLYDGELHIETGSSSFISMTTEYRRWGAINRFQAFSIIKITNPLYKNRAEDGEVYVDDNGFLKLKGYENDSE